MEPVIDPGVPGTIFMIPRAVRHTNLIAVARTGRALRHSGGYRGLGKMRHTSQSTTSFLALQQYHSGSIRTPHKTIPLVHQMKPALTDW